MGGLQVRGSGASGAARGLPRARDFSGGGAGCACCGAGADDGALGATGASAGTETTGTQASGGGLQGIRSGGISQMAKNKAACSATATPSQKNKRLRLEPLTVTPGREAMIAGEDSRNSEGAGGSRIGSRRGGGRMSGNLITEVMPRILGGNGAEDHGFPARIDRPAAHGLTA